MSKVRRGRRRGVSLIEILIALTVFVTSYLMILGVFPASTRAVARARDMNFAAVLAERVMEDWRAKGFTGIASANLVNNPISQADIFIYHTNNGVDVLSRYIYNVQATAIGASIYDVQVTMQWNGGADTGSAVNASSGTSGSGSDYHSIVLESQVGQ